MDVSDILYFSCSGEKGESEAPGKGGGSVFIENPRRGGGGFQEGEGSSGREGVCGELGNFFWGGGAKYFFSGPNVHQASESLAHVTLLTTPRLRFWCSQLVTPWQ